MRDNVSEPFDGPSAGRIPPERNVGPNLIVIGRVFREDSPKVLSVNTSKWSVHSRRIEPIKRSAYPFCQGERNDVGRSRIPIARTRALNATPNALSLSRMRYFGALSQGNASVIWRANHSAVGLRGTANHNNARRLWPGTRNAKSG